MRPAVVASASAGNRTPTTKDCPIDVRNHGGELVGRITLSTADELVAACLVSPITTRHGRIKYFLLNRDEPILERPWRGGSRTTYKESIPAITGISKITQHKAARL